MATRDKILSINLNRGMDTKSDSRIEAECDLLQNATLDKEYTPRKRNGFSLVHDVGVQINAIAEFNNDLYEFGTLKTYKNGQEFANFAQNALTIRNGVEAEAVVYLDSGAYVTLNRLGNFIKLFDQYGVEKGFINPISGKIFKVGNKCVLIANESTILKLYVINDDATLTYSSFDIINPVTAPDIVTSINQHVLNATEFFISATIQNAGTANVHVYKLNTSGTILASNTATSYATTNYDTKASKIILSASGLKLLVAVYVTKAGADEKRFHVLEFDPASIATAPTDRYYLVNWTNAEQYDESCSFITGVEISGVIRWFFTNYRNAKNAGVTIVDDQENSAFGGAYSYKFDYNITAPQASASRIKDFFTTWYVGRGYVLMTDSFAFQGKHSAFFDVFGSGILYIDESVYSRFYENLYTFITPNISFFDISCLYPPTLDGLYKIDFKGAGAELSGPLYSLDFNSLKITQPFVYNGYLVIPSSLVAIIPKSGAIQFPDDLIFPVFGSVADAIGGTIPAGLYGISIGYTSGPISTTKNVTVTNNAIEFTAIIPEGSNLNVYVENEGTLYRDNTFGTTSYDTPNDLGVRFRQIKLTSSTVQKEEIITLNDVEKNLWPPMSCMTIWKNRLAGVAANELNKVWYSSAPDDDFTSTSRNEAIPFFSGLFALKINDIRADNTGLLSCVEVLDDKLLMFKGSSVFMTFGDGPSNTGELTSPFADPQLINSEVGSIEPRSLITTSYGLYFKSFKGVYIMGRSLQFEYIGKEMEAYNNLQITGATSFEKKNLVLFTTQTGVAMLYDTTNLKWSIFTNFECNASNLTGGQITFARNDGKIYKMDSSYSDAGVFIPFKMIIGWIRLGEPAIQNFQRVKRFIFLGKWKSKHKLKFSMQYDYEDFIEEEVIYTPSGTYNITSKPTNEQLYTGTNNGVYEVEHCLKKQKCQALKVTIEDVKDSVIGESLELTNLSLIIGMKKGTNKVNNYKKV